MHSRKIFRRALFAAALVAPLLANAARPADTFRNGGSVYGEPSQAASTRRIVDVTAVNQLSVNYGETVTFTNGHEQFTWAFDGLDRRSLDLAKIAPTDFESAPFTIYVGIDPSRYE